MGKKIFILAALLTAALAFEMPAFANAESAGRGSPFSDVSSGDWFCAAVLEGKERGIIDGYTDGCFRPERTLSYGEFIKMAVGGEKADGPGTHWASGCYNYAKRQGYFTEREISRNALNDPIPRRDMALIFAGILSAEGYEEGALGRAPFTDVGFSERCEYQIAICADSGVLSGYSDGSFRPEASLSRAEAASALVRFCRLMDSLALGQGIPGYKPGENGGASYIDTSEYVETAYPDDPELYTDGASGAPPDAADSELKSILDGILSSAVFTGSEGCVLSYSKPQIAADMHFSLRISVSGKDPFYYQSDAGYRTDPGLYDPSAGDFTVKMPGLSGNDVSCLFTLSGADGSRSVSYQLKRSSEGELSLSMSFHNGAASTRVRIPVPEGIFER